jgi:hypothetical protein
LAAGKPSFLEGSFMADDMYDESSPSMAEDASIANGSNDTKGAHSDETEDKLALVPKHFFKDEPKPGNREMVEIVEVYEGEVSIRCVYGDDAEKDESEESEETMEKEPTDAAYE